MHLIYCLQLYMSEKAKRDIGVGFKKQVQTRKDVNAIGSFGSAADGITHSIKDAEVTAFSQWINRYTHYFSQFYPWSQHF